MSLILTAQVTRSQMTTQGSLASHHNLWTPDRRRLEVWAEIETSNLVRGVGHVKRYPAASSTKPPETWTITAYLQAEPTVQAKITEIDVMADLDRFNAGQPYLLVSVIGHESRAGVANRAWEFGDLYLPGVVRDALAGLQP